MEMVEDKTPDTRGWYAVEYFYDPEEARFGDALYWDGKSWIDKGDKINVTVSFVPITFQDRGKALLHAKELRLGDFSVQHPGSDSRW
jgi:hypothetical protein